jgi:hypothetical protein
MLTKILFTVILLLTLIIPIFQSQTTSIIAIGFINGLIPISIEPINSTYLIFYDNISAYYVMNVSTSGIEFKEFIIKGNLVASFNNNFYKFNLTTITPPSVSAYGGKLLIVLLATNQKIINITSFSLTKNLSVYYMFFDGKYFTNPTPLINFGFPESVLTNGTHILVLWKASYNASKTYLLIFQNFKIIRNVSLTENITSLVMFYKDKILAINSPLLGSLQSLTRISSPLTTNFSIAYVIDFNGSIIKEFSITSVGKVHGSPELFYVNNYGGFRSVITIYNLTSGKLVQQFTLPYIVTNLFILYNRYIVYSGVRVGALETNQILQVMVYKGGSWYNYTSLVFPPALPQSLTYITLVGAGFSNSSTTIFLINSTNYIVSRTPPIQIQSIILPWNLTINFTPPPKPEVNIRQVTNLGQTTLYIHYNENNANLYGVYNITIYLNNKIIYTSSKPSGTISYNVYENGTYNLVVIAMNIFGTTNTTKQIKVIVLPKQVNNTQTVTTTTTTTITTSITTTTKSTTQTFTTTSIQTSTSQLTNVTQQGGIPLPIIIAVIIIIVIVAILVFLLLKRYK